MADNRESTYGTSGSNFGQSGDAFTGSSEQRMGSTETGVLGSAKQMASGLMDQVTDKATTQAQEKKQTMVSGLHSVADAFRQMSDELKERDNGPVAQYAAQFGHALGNKADDLSRYMDGRHVREMANDLQDFARRKPAVFLGGALFLGLAASRFLRSSRPASSNRFADRDYDSFGMRPAGAGLASTSSPYSSEASFPVQGSDARDWTVTPAVVTTPTTQVGNYGAGHETDDKLGS